VAAFGLTKFKMAAASMVPKVQKMKPNFAQIGGFFLFWWPFWIHNGHHSKPKWSPYIVQHILLPVKSIFMKLCRNIQRSVWQLLG
jgi:hypothetical protein